MNRILRCAILLVVCLAIIVSLSLPCAALSIKVHAYYYPWYSNLDIDGNWNHWGDSRNTPPDAIAASFYPLLGPYSSKDPAAVHQHMKWLIDAGVGVIVTSWWGRGTGEDSCVNQILDIANLYVLRLPFILNLMEHAQPRL